MGLVMDQLYPGPWQHPTKYGVMVRYKPTGEFRAPKAGEFFLSGAIIQAYRADNDLTQEYYIARMVPVRQKVVWEETEQPDPDDGRGDFLYDRMKDDRLNGDD